MTDKDIKKIEKELDIKLPNELVKYYLKNPLSGIEEFEELKGDFILDPDILIKENKKLREKGLQKKPFNFYHFCIGHSHKTDFYLIDLRDDKVKVYGVENNKSWAYNPDDLTDNELSGYLKWHIKTTKTYLNMFKDRKRREKKGIPDEEMTDAEKTEFAYKMLDDISAQIEKHNRK